MNTLIFFTCTVVNSTSVFTNRDIVQIVLDSLNYLQVQKLLKLYGYVIMENSLIIGVPTQSVGTS